MLAAKREIKLPTGATVRTPLLVPSFSSKGFADVDKILKTTSEFIDGPILISAYDLYYKHIVPPVEFPSLLFIDSGGYEASRDSELSDYGAREHHPEKWSRQFHKSILDKWKSASPTIAVSYDHPRERLPIAKQIARALETLDVGSDKWSKEILLKPETEGQAFLQVEPILKNVRKLADFDIVGITEKEIGSSTLDRMINIARLRRAMNDVGIDVPIHVFGSLDTVSTPLYFLAGADVFDGLTWLRFAYHNGYTIYKQNFATSNLGLGVKMHLVDAQCWSRNYGSLNELQLAMRRYLKAGDFSSFDSHRDLFKSALESVIEQVGE
jgi:hypothetical protein